MRILAVLVLVQLAIVVNYKHVVPFYESLFVSEWISAGKVSM